MVPPGHVVPKPKPGGLPPTLPFDPAKIGELLGQLQDGFRICNNTGDPAIARPYKALRNIYRQIQAQIRMLNQDQIHRLWR